MNLSAVQDWYGMERITFRATDPSGALAEQTVTIVVFPVNDPPFIRPVPEQRVNGTTFFLDLRPYLGDVDNNATDLVLNTSSPYATVVQQGILFDFPGDGTEDVDVVVSDGVLTANTTVRIVVTLPTPSERIPSYLYWIPIPAGAVGAVAFIVYRRRQIEWAFLVTNAGLLVSSVSRRGPTAIDTDLVTGMLTAIMDFSKHSFSDDKERNLERLQLGDRQVAIVKGELSYVAVVYRGRAPGSLLRIMRSFLAYVETRHSHALGDIVDTSRLGEIPVLLQKLVKRGWWPFLSFEASGPPVRPRTSPRVNGAETKDGRQDR